MLQKKWARVWFAGGAIPLFSLVMAMVVSVMSDTSIGEKQRGERLHAVALAVHAYCEVYDDFPLSSVEWSGDTPLLSWRLPVLSYVDSKGSSSSGWPSAVLWNDGRMLEHGRLVASYFSFSRTANTDSRVWTSILAVTGPDCLFRYSPEGSIKTNPSAENKNPLNESRQISLTGMRNTVMLIEVFNSGVDCLEPVDLVLKGNSVTLRGSVLKMNIPRNVRGFHVAFGDGSVWLLSKSIPLERLIPLMAVSSAESLDRDKMLSEFKISAE